MAFLAVLTADGGVPLFTRTSGEVTSKLPFAAVGSLNGVHMFTRLRNGELKRAVTPEEKIIWREYHKRLVLILITKNDACSDCHMSNLLDNIFAGMAMLIGLDQLLKPGEVMKLQKALVICHPLVDCFLKQLDKEKGNIGDLTRTTDCLLTTDTHLLQDCLNQFLDVADSLYGCLLIKGKVAVASKEWWLLTNQEQNLIYFYVNSLPKVLSRDILIYLPTSSPQNSNRLITLNLLRDVEMCVLCSSEPPLSLLEEEAPKIWKCCFDALKVVTSLHPRNFPISIELDPNIICLLLINTETSQSLCSSVQLSSFASRSKSASAPDLFRQQMALRTLYKLVVGTYFKNKDSEMDKKLQADNTCSSFDYGDIDFGNCQPLEYYIYLEENKCYVISEQPYQLYICYNTEIPNYALRSISHKTLKLLTEKNLFPQT
ncbi:protein fuzzy homolog [Caerostris darwini]|uniref:Protein fuzzy homolog n=1 Tax=Caerostris darwini TaxID=1538125 RepID=A0AAV4WV99_9ARAC|nr:protein fuzzy homolog [Caerostris darwini]